MEYEYKEIEQKWLKYWEENKLFQAKETGSGKKFYCLVMFPYPSGKLHMGHVRNYVIGDVIAQFRRMQGYNVLHPVGWDAFGLPAENAAIKRKIHPAEWTYDNIANMRGQLKQLGISYDWTREFATCDPEYYKWNQWIFLKMYEKGLAYRSKAGANWCPECQTVLANEQASDGKCWRCDSEVENRKFEQWFFKITDYADRLLSGHDVLSDNWPGQVIAMQQNWIGKSVGAEVLFDDILVFTTRPDTLFGATFLVLAPEHPAVEKLITPENREKACCYIEQTKKVSHIQRTQLNREKTGIFTGSYVTNPLTKKKIPVYIADYVLLEYGAGAIMCVPAHDQRDYEFAKKFGLPIVQVIQPPDGTGIESAAYEGDGFMINSGEFNGIDSGTGKLKILELLDKQGIAKKKIHFKLKDWLLSRQRYWGTPIPVIYCDKCGMLPVREQDLPVVLPKNVEFTGQGNSPLKSVKEFYETKCYKCGGKATRETDTMDTFVDSSWYYARYCDSKNDKSLFDISKAGYWLPVDQYIGGIEHACMHLIYSRFFHKFFQDLGLVKSEEPFIKLLTQGMVTLGGTAMSKSKGNVVEVSEVTDRYGVDSARLFILFASPPEKSLEWSDKGIEGISRFISRVYRIVDKVVASSTGNDTVSAHGKELTALLHRTIKKVEEDIEKNYQFNTAISAIMELVNALYLYPDNGDKASREVVEKLILILSPFAPFLCEELWHEKLKKTTSIRQEKWIKYDSALIEKKVIEIVVQIDGKLRTKISVDKDTPEDKIKSILNADEKIMKHLNNNGINRFVYVPNRLFNIITK